MIQSVQAQTEWQTAEEPETLSATSWALDEAGAYAARSPQNFGRKRKSVILTFMYRLRILNHELMDKTLLPRMRGTTPPLSRARDLAKIVPLEGTC
jgi:hypothetical protein